MLRRKQLLCRTSRILRIFQFRVDTGFCHRKYSWLRSIDSHQEKDEIKDWVKGSLHEPLPAQHFPDRLKNDENNNITSVSSEFDYTITMISEGEYRIQWRDDFRKADLNTVGNVIEKAQQGMLFDISQIIVLVRALRSVQRDYEIHELYCAYRKYLHLMDGGIAQSSLIQEFLEIVLRVEESLGNFDSCETLFSEYIKYPKLDPQIILIGLRTFIRNDNLQLAKQFFIQVLDNPDTFPITTSELKLLLSDLSKFNELDTVKFIFRLWLTKKCDDNPSSFENYPDYDILSTMHRLYLRLNDKDGLEKFLTLEAVKRSNYPNDVMFEIVEFCHQLRRNKTTDDSDENDLPMKMDSFLLSLQNRRSDRRKFYLLVLDSLVKRNDFASIRHVVSRVKDDAEIHLDGAFHLKIATFFVKQGLLSHLLQYYSEVVRTQAAGRIRLKVAHIEQLWLCAIQTYPSLTREITNEVKVLLDKDKFVRQFTGLQRVIKQTSQVKQRRQMGGQEYVKSALTSTDFEKLQKFESAISRSDVAGATTTILESLKQGARPRFDFYFSAVRICLRSSLPALAKVLSDVILKSYNSPLKLNILWLRYDALNQYRSTVSKSEMLSSNKVPLIETQLKEFERGHQSSLNFQNYLQLAQISIGIRDYHHASLLVEKSFSLIDNQDRQQWLMYYMTALKLAARLYDSKEFIKVLRHWNQNPEAKLISRGCIRQIKAFIKLFEKRRDQVSDYDAAVRHQMSKEVEFAVEKYVNLKFEGLNETRKLCNILASWLKQEMKERSKIERKRRKVLNLSVAKYSDKA